MSTIGGPKGRNPALERFLEGERAKRAANSEAQVSPVPVAPEQGRPADDRFADMPALSGPARAVTGTFVSPFAQGAAAVGQGALSVRLGAMTGGELPTTGSERVGLRVVNGPAGRIAEGDLSVRKASDLDALLGVVRLRGSLDLSETLVEAQDLAALSTLARIDGGLALEGNAALASLEALSQLAHVGGNLYLGFNEGLAAVSLPSLARVDGALIVEGNPALTELSLPALAQVGSYLHLHENDTLSAVELGNLAALGGELSLLDNPLLHEVGLAALRVTPPSIS